MSLRQAAGDVYSQSSDSMVACFVSLGTVTLTFNIKLILGTEFSYGLFPSCKVIGV